jgi:hypothetical protein
VSDRRPAPHLSPWARLVIACAVVVVGCAVALAIAAVVAAIAGPLMWFGLRPRDHPRCADSPRHVMCPVDGPPLQVDAVAHT